MRETTDRMSDWVPALRIAHLADAGHFAQTDAPEVVNELLIDFARQA